MRKRFSQIARLSSFQRSGTGSTPGSSQRSWSGCCLWGRRNKTVRRCHLRREVSCETCCEVRWFSECAEGQRNSCEHLEPWALSLTHVRVKVKCAQTCATRQDWEKCACDEVFCLHSQSLTRESPFPVSDTPWKNLRIHHLWSLHWWSRHWVSWCSRHWEYGCSCCHQFCEDDEGGCEK